MELWILYLIIINAAAFLLMLTDKYRAQNKLWRIPEAMLLLAAAIGGSFGSLLGMYLVRHKTKHPRFAVGVPFLLVAHIILAYLFLL